jgi:PKD repeat protein
MLPFMKKQSSIFLVLLCAIASICLINSCTKAPAISACIATAPSTSSVGATVAFTSCTAGATGYTWHFGDGSSATGDSVTHVYTTAGVYKASLTVNSGSAVNTKGLTVTIVPNSWAFKGVTYSIDSVVTDPNNGTLTASGSNGTNSANLIFRLFPFPTRTYYYTVINAENGNNAPAQLYVLLNKDSAGVQTMYGSTGSYQVQSIVTVIGGQVSVSLPTIEMVNLSNANDSTALSGTVAQTQ